MLDKNKVYGLSLEGGGLRGSYQAGAICALFEKGIKIGAVCGTSIGALNGALVAMKKPEKLKELWYNFDISDLFKLQNDDMEKALTMDFKDIDALELGKGIVQTTFQGGLNIDPLKEFIRTNVNENEIRNSDIDMGLVTYNLSELKAEELMVKDIKEGQLHDYLMASAYLPAFKLKKIRGKYYIDGGVYNNLPTNMLAELGFDDTIEIPLHRFHTKIRPKRKVNKYTIKFKEYLGPIILYKKERIIKNFENGYRDAIEFIEK